MPSEYDHLLPQDPPAPEITGQGFSVQTSRRRNAQEVHYNGDQGTIGVDDVSYGTITNDKTQNFDKQAEGYSSINESDHSSPHFNPDEHLHSVGDQYHQNETVARKAKRSAYFALLTLFVATAFVFLLSMNRGYEDDRGGGGDHVRPVPVPGHPPSPSKSVEERAEKILRETPLIDGHNDLAIFFRMVYQNKIHTPGFRSKFEKGGMDLHVDIPRLRKGMVGGAFWSAFVPCPVNASYDFSDSTYSVAVSSTLSQIDVLHRLQLQYPSVFSSATTPLSDALSAFHSTNRTLVSPISIEGLHQIPPSAPLSSLRHYYNLGVRAATLTWNCHNIVADAALISDFDPSTGKFETTVAPNYRPGGLTTLGRKVIREMNRLGMLVDLSHTSYWTQISVLTNNTSRSPVIYSHSSVFALCPHPRNVHDDALDLVRETRSLVMINFSPDFISCSPPDDPLDMPPFYEKNSTLEQVVRHVIYIGERIGYDYVGFGSDFDGIESTPTSLPDVSAFPDLVISLLKHNVSDVDVSKIVGGNLLRVWREVEKISRRMRDDEGVVEGEDDIPKDSGF